MKSFSCISLSRPESSIEDYPIEVDSHKDLTKTYVLGHKGPKMKTIVEVLRCELARPGRQQPTDGNNGIGPSKDWTPLHYAVYHNREVALVHFLRAGQSPNGPANVTHPPLCVAVAAGHIGIVRILCAAGANIRAPVKSTGETALHLAIKQGQSEIMDVLLPYEPDLNAQTTDKRETPLHYAAAKSGSLAPVVTILRQGANYEVRDSSGRSAAEVAFGASNIPAAVAIISAARGKRGKLAKEKEMLLRHVEKSQNRFSMNNDLIEDIFVASCDPDSTVLIEAIKRDDVGLTEMFLGKGADPNRPTTTGLHPIFAALNCSGAQIVQLLTKHGVDVTVRDAEGLSVLQAALDSPSAHDKEAISGIVEALLTHGADPKVTYPDGKTLLHHAVATSLGLSRVAQRLLEHGIQVDRQDSSGHTALHLATHSRSCIEVLLKNGASANMVNQKGLTPLLFAASTSDNEAEPDLGPLIKVSNLRATDKHGKTALHFAAQKGLQRTVRALLKYRAETPVVDSKNRTPLILAAQNHQWSVIPFLAVPPAVNSWDENGTTALHYIATSVPKESASWKDIAVAASKFCEGGVSRSMRNRSGATPLIEAIKNLPEAGLPVIEALLAEKEPGRSNCVGHEDHKRRSALYYAATLEKPSFVRALLANGGTFELRDWTAKRSPIQATIPANKQTLKYMAEYEWVRRAKLLHRRSGSASPVSMLPEVLPLGELKDLLSMGLDPNALPTAKSYVTCSLLWMILNQTVVQPPLPSDYLIDVLTIVFKSGANANEMTTDRSSVVVRTPDPRKLTRHPLTFLLEQHALVDIDVITLFLDNGANLTTASPLFEGRFPLHSAVKANRLDVVDEILIRRTTANSIDSKKRTPLHIAASQGLWEIVDNLLRCGANINVQDTDGNTPLHVAAAGGSARTVSSLLRVGASASMHNAKGATSISMVPEPLQDKEKNKMIAVLKHYEEQEKRDAELKQKQLERDARREGKERLRKERSELLLQQQRQSSNTLSKRPSLAAATSSSTISSANVRVSAHDNKKQPQLRTASLPIQQPSQPAPTKTATNTEKPIPQPRVDSGVGQIRSASDSKALPVLDRSKQTLNDKSEATKLDSKEDFSDWLELTKMLDRL